MSTVRLPLSTLACLLVAPCLIAWSTTGANAGAWEYRLIEPETVTVATDKPELDGFPVGRLNDARRGRPWMVPAFASNDAVVTMKFDRKRWIAAVEVTVGHAGNNATYRETRRPGRVTVRWPGGEQRWSLRDSRAPQRLLVEGIVVTDSITLIFSDPVGPAGEAMAVGEVTLYEPRDRDRDDPSLRAHLRGLIQRLGEGKEADAAAQTDIMALGQQATTALLTMTAPGASTTTTVKRRALAILRVTDPESAQQLLITLLKSSSHNARLLALQSLWHTPDASLGDRVAAVRTDDPELSAIIIEVLGKLTHPALAERVEVGAFATDQALVTTAMSWLHTVGPDASQIVCALMRDSRAATRLAAAATARHLTSDSTLRSCLSSAVEDDADPLVRDGAIAALVTHADAAQLRALVGRIGSLDPARRLSPEAIASVATSGAIGQKAFVTRLRSVQPALAEQVLAGLAMTRELPVSTLLATLYLTEFGYPHHIGVTSALERHGHLGLSALLRGFDVDPRHANRTRVLFLPSAKAMAHEAAERLVSGRFARSGPHGNAQDSYALLLMELVTAGPREPAVDALHAVFDDPFHSLTLRRAALRGLGVLPHARSVATVLTQLADPEGTFIDEASEAARLLRLAKAVPILAKRLTESSRLDWNPHLVQALATLGDRQALVLLADGYPYTNRDARKAILVAARGSTARRLLQLLYREAVGKDREMRRLAMNILSGADSASTGTP